MLLISLKISAIMRVENKEENKKWGENSQAEQIESALPWVPVAGIIMEGGGRKQIVRRQIRRNKMKKNCPKKRIYTSLKSSTEQLDRK